MADQQTISFSPSDIDQPGSSAIVPQTQPAQPIAGAQPITFSPQDIDQTPAAPIPSAPAGEDVDENGVISIVPKPGESFSDTMKRAAAHGKELNAAHQQNPENPNDQ